MSDPTPQQIPPTGSRWSLLRRIDRLILAANRWLLIIGLALMSIIIFIAVVLRYTVALSVPWSEEVARYLMLWITFAGIGPVFREGGHVAIDSLEKILPRRGAQILRALVIASVIGFLAYCTWIGISYTQRTALQTTPVTDISFAWVAASLPVGFLLALWHIGAVLGDYVRDRKFENSEIEAEVTAL